MYRFGRARWLPLMLMARVLSRLVRRLSHHFTCGQGEETVHLGP